MYALNPPDFQISSVLDFESLKIYLKVFLFLGFLEFVIGRIFLHAPQLSNMLLLSTLIIMNLEALMEIPILISFLYILWKDKNSHVTTVLFGLSFVLLGVAILLYFFSFAGVQVSGVLWLYFLFVALATIFVASAKRIFAEMKERRPSNFLLIVFLALVNLTYLCVYIYFSSFNLSTYFGINVPEPITLFYFAQNLILIDALVLFLYALSTSYDTLRLGRKLLFKVFLFPSIIIALLFIALVAMPTGSRFDIAEIISLVLSMWGFAVPKSQVFIYIIMLWFFLVAASLLREKGQETKHGIYTQEFIAAFLMFFAGFLSTSPYLLMGVIAIILFSGKMT